MLRGVLAGAVAVALAANAYSSRARAADAPGAYDWTGFYAGVNAGAAFGSYDPTTAAALSPTYLFKPVDVAAVNAAGKQRVNPLGFAGGIQAGYNRQFGPLVIGVESDFGYLHLNGAANSGGIKYPGGGSGNTNGGFPLNQFVIGSYVNADWMATLRPRLGVASDNWLFYVTGGLALTKLEGEFLFTDGNAVGGVLGAAQEADVKSVRAGYIVGGGVETAVGDRLRLKAEYAFVNFGTVQAQEVSQNFQCCFPAGTAQIFTQSMKLTTSLVRVGLNYSFADSNSDTRGAPSWLTKLFARQEATEASTWGFDVGTRAWFSSGTVGAPNPLLGFPPLPSNINSRLTYEELHAWSGETFARADHISGFFIKGFLGAGGITSGTLVDEDFPGFGGAYSNTISPLSGHLGYANIDFGYTFLTAPGAKVGAFVGYNYFSQHINGFGCTQVAGDTTCVGSDPNFQVFAEDERYDSLRVGLSAQFMLSEKLIFSADVAYLPLVKFRAQDDHNYRQLLIPESSNHGNGVMLEAILGYNVTPNWNIAVGGRFWAWNMHDGIESFDFLGLPATEPQLGRFNSERYGAFVQTSYRWGDTTPLASADAAVSPMRWSGFYIGGHGGGAISQDRWADPYGATLRAGLVNVPGFGDTIHGTGALGGAQAGVNWQNERWVLGIQGDWSAADLRGENTCFSGLGGLNCQHIIRSVASVAARAGIAWNRVLAYAKVGGAEATIDYMLLGDTGGPSRGYDRATVTAWGWTAGGGLEYALTDHWTTMCEFEHIDLGNIEVSFPAVVRIRNQNPRIRQTIDAFKLGVNYKFDWLSEAGAQE